MPLELISRLGLDAMEAYKSVPHRGLEVGGLLLGRVSGDGIHVRDFHAVECEHRSGPSFRLSETDMQGFQEAIRRHSDTIGLYRTSTRSDIHYLQQDDLNLFRRHFTTPDSIYLLIQPAGSKAEIFLPENESLVPVHEFPFRAGDLAPEALEPEAVELSAVAPVAVAAAAVPARPRHRRRLPKWWIATGAVLLGMAVGAASFKVLHPAPRVVRTAPPAVVRLTPPVDPAHVGLNVQREGPSVRLYWDRNAPAIRDASKGVLYINDGSHKSQLNLDPSELRTGLISYWPDSKDVTFRLQTFATGYSTDDSIRFVGAASVPERVPHAIDRRNILAAIPEAGSAPPTPQRSTQGTAARAADTRPAAAPPAPRPSPFTALPKPAVAAPVPAATATSAPPPGPAATAIKTTEPQIAVSVEPVGQSRFGRAIGHIPLLRRLKKQQQAYVPPVPVRQVRPLLGSQDRRLLDRPIPVDVRVFVGDTGKVQYVELMRNGASEPNFATLAVYAARRWEFTPARMGDEKVSSEVIVHFRFLPEGPPPQQALAR